MKHYYLFSLICLITITFTGCSTDGDDEYVPVSPVSVDLTTVPYGKLSEYKFFEGDMKLQNPSLGVLPYEPASALFTDYAHKKRFVWLPEGTTATYNGDGKILELPVGSALIKTFYYDRVQNAPTPNATRIIETRVMIRKETGWIFADYVWNSEQTEATLDMLGSFTDIVWEDTDMNGANVTRSATYRIPAEEQCIICHKRKEVVNGTEVTTFTPIGIKPQNLNTTYAYADGVSNQLTKWIEKGYAASFPLPTAEKSAVDYHDETQTLEKRVRSYVDINCAHCHSATGHCDYRPMRFAFTETENNLTNMGVCVDTQDMQGFPGALRKIITPQNVERSMLYYRINTTNETFRMPLHGRTIIHEEGVKLIGDWINSLQPCN